MVKKVALKHGIEPLITFTSVSDRVFDSTVPLIFERDKVEAQIATACYNELLESGRPLGFFPYRVGINTMGALAGFRDHARKFHNRLRDALDPAGILAPGRYD